SMRRIHWRATAHHDTLMVRQEEQESTPEATVVFDSAATRWSPQAAQRPGADPKFEAAITACVSAVHALARDRYAVRVVDASGPPLAEPVAESTPLSLTPLLGALATMTAHGDAPLTPLARVRPGATLGPLVLITGRLSPTEAAELAEIPVRS